LLLNYYRDESYQAAPALMPPFWEFPSYNVFYAALLSGIPLNIPQITQIFSVYTAASGIILDSDWLYLLWHGINTRMNFTCTLHVWNCDEFGYLYLQSFGGRFQDIMDDLIEGKSKSIPVQGYSWLTVYDLLKLN